MLEQARSRGLDTHQHHNLLFVLGAITGDEELMAKQTEWHRGKPSEMFHYFQQSQLAAQAGKRAEALEHGNQATALARNFGVESVVQGARLVRAWIELGSGYVDRAREIVRQIPDDEIPSGFRLGVAQLLARLGEAERARALLEQEIEEKPTSTWVQSYNAPRVRAALAMEEGDPERALEEMKQVRFERASVDVPYERGEMLLAAGRPEEALAEFEKVHEWKGVDPLSPLKSLAHLQKARAYVELGDFDSARNSYLEFLELWSEADETPVLQKARAEYEALPGVRG